MLLHSRQGSGEHRPVDINALVEESLNLAYHGARAEKQGFNITLERSFDPAAGEVDLFPQEITRVLLNLISNGFYAATKRKAEANGGDYEPTLAAATKNLGDRVEIRIRDNGTGIPPEVKEKMFNPFFTTKPAGEGTGLGLSLSHDIIVKQHGGSIEVDTSPASSPNFGSFCRAPALRSRRQNDRAEITANTVNGVACRRLFPAKTEHLRLDPPEKRKLCDFRHMQIDDLILACEQLHRGAVKKDETMTKIELAQIDDSILNFDVSDEALKSAGDNAVAANYTLGACTGLSVCPG